MPSPVSLVVIVSVVAFGSVIVVLPSKAICSCCVSFNTVSDTGEYRPTANGSSPNSIVGVIGVVAFKEVVVFSDIVVVVDVSSLPPATSGDAIAEGIKELKPRSGDSAATNIIINNVTFTRLTLTNADFIKGISNRR
jgi:hypothetical protein